CPTQIPRPRLESCSWIEKLLDVEVGDLIFTRPLICRLFPDLHQPAFPSAAVFPWIEPALPPNHRLHQHRIEMMLQRDGANEAIVLMKPGWAHPFVERVDWITCWDSQIRGARGQGHQHAKDVF